jgi:hypothetical protein
MCTNEACSICPCEPDEVPAALLGTQTPSPNREGLSEENEYGWISRAGEHGKPGGKAHSGSLGKVEREDDSVDVSGSGDTPQQPLDQTWEWTEIEDDSRGVFVNLVKNPEKFTGPSPPSPLPVT